MVFSVYKLSIVRNCHCFRRTNSLQSKMYLPLLLSKYRVSGVTSGWVTDLELGLCIQGFHDTFLSQHPAYKLCTILFIFSIVVRKILSVWCWERLGN